LPTFGNNFGVSCAPFVNVPESWLQLYSVCLRRTLLANVDWDAGGGELNLTERLSNGGQRWPDAINAMVTQGASVGTATACSNDSVSASLLVGLFIDTFFFAFCLYLACLQLSFTATKYTKGSLINVATSSSKQDCQEVSKVRLYIDVAWRGPQAYLRWVFVRLSWTKSATAAHTLHLRWQKFATLIENKYNASKRCQALANAVKRSQTLGNVRKSWIAPDIKRSLCEWKIFFSRT